MNKFLEILCYFILLILAIWANYYLINDCSISGWYLPKLMIIREIYGICS